MSSKNRNKIISFLQSQDSFPFVKFNFTEGNWEVFPVCFFSVWFWFYLLFSSSRYLESCALGLWENQLVSDTAC